MAKSKPAAKKTSNGTNGTHVNGAPNGKALTNGANGTPVHIASSVVMGPAVFDPNLRPPVIDPSLGVYRSMKLDMEEEIKTFRDKMVAKYRKFKGHDLRREVAWYFEQIGTSICNDMEQEKREARARAVESRMLTSGEG